MDAAIHATRQARYEVERGLMKDYGTEKLCIKCKQPKPVSDFRTVQGGRYLSSYCRECARKICRDRYRNLTDEQRAAHVARSARYRQEHAARYAELINKYRARRKAEKEPT